MSLPHSTGNFTAYEWNCIVLAAVLLHGTSTVSHSIGEQVINPFYDGVALVFPYR